MTTKEKLSPEQMIAIANTSPALKYQSPGPGRSAYPANYRGRVPLKVLTAKTVKPDLLQFSKILDIKDDTVALKDNEYYVWVNSYGAVSSILPNGKKLGLLPSEFDVVEWHKETPNPMKVGIKAKLTKVMDVNEPEKSLFGVLITGLNRPVIGYPEIGYTTDNGFFSTTCKSEALKLVNKFNEMIQSNPEIELNLRNNPTINALKI